MTAAGDARTGVIARRGALLLLAAPAIALGQRAQVGEVAALTGSAQARFGDGPARALAQAAPVLHQDLITTGSGPETRLFCRLINGFELKLGANAQVRLDDLLLKDPGRENRLSSTGGPILFDRPPGMRGNPVILEMPWARIGVRGTRFFAGPLDGIYSVFVQRGQIHVESWGDGVLVDAGQGVDLTTLAPSDRGFAAPPGAAPSAGVRGFGRPPLAVRVWGQPRIARALALVE